MYNTTHFYLFASSTLYSHRWAHVSVSSLFTTFQVLLWRIHFILEAFLLFHFQLYHTIHHSMEALFCTNTQVTGGSPIWETITLLQLWCTDKVVWQNTADVIGKQMQIGGKVNWHRLLILCNPSTVREPYVTQISIRLRADTVSLGSCCWNYCKPPPLSYSIILDVTSAQISICIWTVEYLLDIYIVKDAYSSRS